MSVKIIEKKNLEGFFLSSKVDLVQSPLKNRAVIDKCFDEKNYFLNQTNHWTLESNNVTGIFAKKSLSEVKTIFVLFCTDLLPRGNGESVGVKSF